MLKFLQAVLILSGMIIGVGMFGIPFSFARAGFWLGTAELFILAGVVMVFHLLYGEVVLKTPALHRLPGYVRAHLGRRASYLAWISAFWGISFTLLAYILLGSKFLYNIFGGLWPGASELMWAVVITVLGAVITSFSLKKEALINGVLTVALVGLIIFFSAYFIPRVSRENLSGFHPENIFLPYGILLFALSGGVVIPDVITFLGRDRIATRRAIALGSLVPALLYFLWALSAVGVVGYGVSEETIRSLHSVAGERVVILGSIIGFLAAFTSYIVLGASFQALLRLDLGVPRFLSWAIGAAAPFLFYAAGLQNFIVVIGAVGALAVGFDSALVIAMYHRVAGSPRAVSYIWKALLYLLISGGVLYELFSLLG